jgi:hypothetical protein
VDLYIHSAIRLVACLVKDRDNFTFTLRVLVHRKEAQREGTVCHFPVLSVRPHNFVMTYQRYKIFWVRFNDRTCKLITIQNVDQT